ncbi:MAG: helix-turn-helix domain-containing protein [Flavobacteriales bacterium]|nr:helix-turn-helix domain-containing protein [Flavobacteriales bacterium]
MLRGLELRLATGDIDDLAAASAIVDQANAALTRAILALRDQGYSLQDIADRLGTSRQAVHQRLSRAA